MAQLAEELDLESPTARFPLESQIQEAFAKLDANHDGNLYEFDLEAALRAHGCSDSQGMAHLLMEEFDVDHSNSLSLDQFRALMMHALKEITSLPSTSEGRQRSKTDAMSLFQAVLRATNTPLKVGLLYKQGRGRHRWWRRPWAKRTFVFDCAHNRVTYYKGGVGPSGVFSPISDKRGELRVGMCTATSTGRVVRRRGHVYHVFRLHLAQPGGTGHAETLHLAAASQAEAAEWIEIFASSVDERASMWENPPAVFFGESDNEEEEDMEERTLDRQNSLARTRSLGRMPSAEVPSDEEASSATASSDEGAPPPIWAAWCRTDGLTLAGNEGRVSGVLAARVDGSDGAPTLCLTKSAPAPVAEASLEDPTVLPPISDLVLEHDEEMSTVLLSSIVYLNLVVDENPAAAWGLKLVLRSTVQSCFLRLADLDTATTCLKVLENIIHQNVPPPMPLIRGGSIEFLDPTKSVTFGTSFRLAGELPTFGDNLESPQSIPLVSELSLKYPNQQDMPSFRIPMAQLAGGPPPLDLPADDAVNSLDPSELVAAIQHEQDKRKCEERTKLLAAANLGGEDSEEEAQLTAEAVGLASQLEHALPSPTPRQSMASPYFNARQHLERGSSATEHAGEMVPPPPSTPPPPPPPLPPPPPPQQSPDVTDGDMAPEAAEPTSGSNRRRMSAAMQARLNGWEALGLLKNAANHEEDFKSVLDKLRGELRTALRHKDATRIDSLMDQADQLEANSPEVLEAVFVQLQHHDNKVQIGGFARELLSKAA